MRSPNRPPIAVVGVSALFPGSITATGFWNDILSGTDLLTAVPPSHWLISDYYDEDMRAKDKTYGRRGGFLSEVGLDAMGFGIPPNMLASTDTSQLLALIVAQQVLEDAARGQFSEMDRSRCSVILGVTSGQELLGVMASRMNRPMWLQGMRRAGVPEDEAQAACEQIANLHPEWTESTFPGLLGNVVAGRIANRLDLGGTNCVTDAACASSFSALSMGVNELYLGDSDMVIAGGVDTMNDIFMYMCFSKTPALSKSEDIRPFSDRADGTMLGEGLGMVALKRLEDAERDGNDIYCIINGVGASSDGRSKSVYAPVSAGQARALSNTYDKTSYGPDTVELLEAHGTGTVAGDAAEFGGMELAFNASGRKDRQWCALGTVKSQIGHTKAAAGAAGLFKVIMALHHKVLPQTLKIDLPNPKLDLEASPFHLNTKTRPWVRGSDHERRGSVSSFGFGGSNFHVAMSEYTGSSAKAPRLRTCDVELVLITGINNDDIIDQAKKYIASANENGYLKWLAQTSQLAYTDANARLALVAKDEVELVEKLEAAIAQLKKSNEPFSTPTGIHYGIGDEDGSVAFVFPGQGSQYLFMGADLTMNYDEAMKAWDRAADLNWKNENLQDIVFPITTFQEDSATHQHSRLTQTEWAQPAIGTTSLAMLNLLSAMGIAPAHVGGHSYGEITALHAAGVLSATQMLEVSRRRGELMADAAQSPGAMIAVVSTIDDIRAFVDASGVDVVIANHNSPNQVVLSGPTSAIEEIEVKLAAQKITAKRLSVATAFHSKVVSGASTAFTEFLQDIDFEKPNIPVYANETAKPYPKTAKKMRSQLGRQLANSVRFVEMIEEMYNAGARTFVEVGASSILTSLIGKILADKPHLTIPMDNKRKTGMSAFMGGLAQLVAAGVRVDFAALWKEYGEFENPHEIEKPRLVIPINGANHNKPYPPQDLAELVGPNPNRLQITPTPKPPMSNDTKTKPVHNAPSMTSPFAPVSKNLIPQPVSSPSISAGVLSSYEAMQQQTANAHIAYLNAMANSHSAFLATAKQGLAALGNLTSSEVSDPIPGPVFSNVVEPIVMARPAPVAIVPPTPVAIVPTPIPTMAPISTVPPISRPDPIVKKSNISRDSLMTLLLDVVSEKTGYPSDMLNMGMELESELGIDSIKRVEILSAMQDAVPELPEVDTSIMAELVTLGQIVDYMNGEITASDPGSLQTESVTPTVISRESLMALLLEVVSEKTGYPSDMLNMGMELESELGIDSIKRVEILSAMQDEVPELPEVDTSIMAELVTLGQIVDYMNGEIAMDDPTQKKNTKNRLGRYVLQALPQAATNLRMKGIDDGKIVVINDGLGIGPVLVDLLKKSSVQAELFDKVPKSDYAGIIFLGGLRKFETSDDAIDVNREAFGIARAIANSVSFGGIFVTVSDNGGAFGYNASTNTNAVQAWSSGVTGLVRTAAIEWPTMNVKAIDIEKEGREATVIAELLAKELLEGGPELEVGFPTHGERIVLESKLVSVEGGPMPLTQEDVIVVSGGARGVTAVAMIELAKASKASFVLLGRSVVEEEPPEAKPAKTDAALKRVILDLAIAAGEKISPSDLGRKVGRILASREILGTLAAIEKVGGRAKYLSVDITKQDAIVVAFRQIRKEFGRISGIVHGAGVLADKRIAEKTDDQFNRVFNTKVEGLENLLFATADDPIKLLCLFSSVAARTGNQGQSDYAMANEILNKVAIAEHHRRGPGVIVKSLGWGPWEGGMVSPGLKAHFESMGVALIPLEEGAKMLVDEIASPQFDQVELVLGGGVLEGSQTFAQNIT